MSWNRRWPPLLPSAHGEGRGDEARGMGERGGTMMRYGRRGDVEGRKVEGTGMGMGMGMGWTEMDWDGLGWTGMDWDGIEWDSERR